MPVGNKYSNMDKKFYTNERNVQIVINLLKAHGIQRVIASPGTTNMTFVGSIQNDPWFQIWSSVDERSAAYLACGMAEESGEPVVLSCTGATASRNYMPGLTEAFYRKLPILAITSHRGESSIGHLLDQQIDRRQIPNDIAVESVTIPIIRTPDDEKFCTIETNKAILSLFHRGGGPAHINLYTEYSKDFSVQKIPEVRVIRRYTSFDILPEIPVNKRIAIFVGSHITFSEKQIRCIDKFCEQYNSVVICDRTSGYHGQYGVHMSLVNAQDKRIDSLLHVDLIIHVGEVSGDPFGKNLVVKEVWRINEDGELRDSWGKLSTVFEMPEEFFFSSYLNEKKGVNLSYYKECKSHFDRITSMIPELPFGNIWIAQVLHDKLPDNSVIHLGIFNTLRSWNFFEVDSSIRSNCNVGGFGIDGGVSSLIGASLCNPQKLYYGVFGDLAFFYDMNVIGNRHVGNNVRILLINNGKGNEFRLSMHPCNIFGDDADKYMAAAGHYGNKSHTLIKHYAEDLGYKYMCATDKQSFIQNLPSFVNPKLSDQPIIYEVFTEMEDERNALDRIMNIDYNTTHHVLKGILGVVEKTPLKGALEITKKIIKK